MTSRQPFLDSAKRDQVPVSKRESRRVFALDSLAMARLAQATAVAIAWLLILPDAVALLPSSPDFLTWFIKLLGLWISALVLWYVGFLGILHIVRLAGEGVSTDTDGIRLWRFAKPIPWERIEAVEVEPQEAFSKLFSLKPMAYRLIFFERPKKTTFKIFHNRLIVHNIPSFLFSPEKFTALTESICMSAMGTVASVPNVLLVPPASLKKLRLMHKMMAGQRLLLTLIVAFGLLSLLGRKAFVNYSYNYGNRCLSEKKFAEAKDRYKLALALEPPFAAGWYNLAVTEYDMSDFAAAERHWKKALLYKPDYVEAKVSLANMYIRERKFKEAGELLNSALNLAPLDAFALVNRADLNVHLGHYNIALGDARTALAQGERNPALRYMATCLSAEAKLNLGDANAALKMISTLGPVDDAHQGENVAFRMSVESHCLSQLNRQHDAEKLARQAVERAPASEHELFGLIDILLLSGQFEQARKFLAVAQQRFPSNPYTQIGLCRDAINRKDNASARTYLASLVKSTSQDAVSLVESAQLARELQDNEQAKTFALHSLSIEPDSKTAQNVLQKLEDEQPAAEK